MASNILSSIYETTVSQKKEKNKKIKDMDRSSFQVYLTHFVQMEYL